MSETLFQAAPGRRQLAQMIAGARRIVIFTGAGISTESGVPDFRSPGGVWSRMKPIYFQEFVGDEARRREAWNRVYSGAAGWTGARPNDGHTAVARLITEGRASAVITQNVDNLHQESGVPDDKIIELHGNAHYARCLACGLRHEFSDFRESFLERGEIPTCRACGGLVKSATISFGQAMPEEPMEKAQAATFDCDLFLVLGSSLVVYPAAGFPIMAKRGGAMLAIVNREPTDQDGYADLVLHDEIGSVMREAVGS
ncbi:Sir2 family NAD-dependent protein deacetylase [Phenylobacterium sp. Root700]|uniref:SIR2 family NAD-dependent protein deacylase n=1 Tax=Phenylobacterium sp. Root700 TaxID=1736591 RepID=UPI0006F1F8DD|nr:Sir2 family NAD-dependent protein deacetylase [Phenylobacterium sp. Root700]KRB41736.1 NAD-dependent deacetylase [Phenylobacterium sp. Root700]